MIDDCEKERAVQTRLNSALDLIRNKKKETINKIDFLNRYRNNKRNIQGLYYGYQVQSAKADICDRVIKIVNRAKSDHFILKYMLKFARSRDSFVAKMIFLCATEQINENNIRKYYFYKKNESRDLGAYYNCSCFKKRIEAMFAKSYGSCNKKTKIDEYISYKNIYNSTNHYSIGKHCVY
jgi:hypothetical protein